MSNFSASIPAANMQAANAELEEAGHGPNNSRFPPMLARHLPLRLLHAWGDPVFEAAVASIAGVTITQGTDPIEMTSDAAVAAGSTWGQDAKPLTGTVTPGLYKDADGVLWWVIQSYNTATYPNPLVIPALIRVAKIPGEALPWQQPLDQYDAYKLVNPFTGEGDYSLHKGVKWQVTAGRWYRQQRLGAGCIRLVEHRPRAADPVEPRWRPVRRCGDHPKRQPDGHRRC